MSIIRGKSFTLSPTSKVNVFADSGKRLSVNGEYVLPTITGGDIADVTIDNVTYKTHTFTATGILTVTSAMNDVAHVEYLVVGGGGGGGSYRQCNGGSPTQRIITQPGGGAGAGGFLSDSIALSVGNYEIIVGAAGAGGIYPGTPDGQSLYINSNSGTNGGPSKISFYPNGAAIVESFGGGGGGSGGKFGLPGGSGGGGGVTNAPYFTGPPAGNGQSNLTSLPGGIRVFGQGNDGSSGQPDPNVFATSTVSGGGGGAGGVGGSPTYVDGGLGLTSKFNSLSTTYSTGGSAGSGSVGSTNTGNGGGGGPSPGGNGASGGSGIVIIRYRI
jgi:hypothetical protein